MSKECNMIKDLLPLYADDVCSEDSRKAVEEHIKNCPSCKTELEKLGKGLNIAPQKDADVLKRIKRRLRIEKIVVGLIGGLAICGALICGLVYFINDYKSMDMDKYKILENVSATERDNAVWLNISGYAASFDVDVPTLSDANGKHLGIDDDFDSEKKNGYGVTLKQRRIDDFSFNPTGSLKTFELKLFDLDEKKDMMKVFYYDDKNNKEYILWERG